MNNELIKLNLKLLQTSTMSVSELSKVQILITTLENMLGESDKTDKGLDELWDNRK